GAAGHGRRAGWRPHPGDSAQSAARDGRYALPSQPVAATPRATGAVAAGRAGRLNKAAGCSRRPSKNPCSPGPHGFFMRRYVAYWAALTMYSTAARMSSSDALAAPPLGGMAPLPVIATFTMASMPVLI